MTGGTCCYSKLWVECVCFNNMYTTWYILFQGDRGGTVVKVLCYRLEGRWFDPRWCHWNFLLTQSFWSHCGPGVDSASNRNEYQEDFLGVIAASAWGWQPYHLSVPLSWNLGTLTSWNPLVHSRPVTGLLYLILFQEWRMGVRFPSVIHCISLHWTVLLSTT